VYVPTSSYEEDSTTIVKGAPGSIEKSPGAVDMSFREVS
jgi:hypothetical protein